MEEHKFEPITASADGKRNAYSIRCESVGQVMNYAACLWRQGVLSKPSTPGIPDIRTPADWSPCAEAAKRGQCVALQMRKEEEVKGYSIYFQDRSIVRRTADAAIKWVAPAIAPIKQAAKRVKKEVQAITAPAPAKKEVIKHASDRLVAEASYADAINAMAKETAPVEEKVGVPAAAPIQMLPGESPLEYIRRTKSMTMKGEK